MAPWKDVRELTPVTFRSTVRLEPGTRLVLLMRGVLRAGLQTPTAGRRGWLDCIIGLAILWPKLGAVNGRMRSRRTAFTTTEDSDMTPLRGRRDPAFQKPVVGLMCCGC